MKVKFMPQDVEFEIQPGQSVMALAHEKGVAIRSTCNGMPSCAECRVRVIDGDWNTSPPSRKELNLIGTGFYIDQRRLACQVMCFGDITVDTSEQIEKSSEGPVTKKFLTKVHKASAQDSHSVGGVLIEQDNKLLEELQKDVSDAPTQPLVAASLREKREDRGGQNRGPNHQSQRQNAQSGGGERGDRGGGRRRGGRRRGRGGRGGGNGGGGNNHQSNH